MEKGVRGEKKRRGMGLGGRKAWVLRRAGPHNNNADRHECFFSFSSSARGQTTQTTPLIEARYSRVPGSRNHGF